MDLESERALRQIIISELAGRLTETDLTITRDELSSFPIGSGRSVRLVDTTRGIRNPVELQATLSVVSDPKGPYNDRYDEAGLFRYSYRAGSIEGDNTKLRRAMELQLPIILLRKIRRGLYMPVLPVYVVDDDLSKREFVLVLDEDLLELVRDPSVDQSLQRRYAERAAWVRLHQPEFRIRVLSAYRTLCTVCRLRRRVLLDAAHITKDRDERGDPVTSNGLSLCKIHHAAYDQDLLGITPDYQVRINTELLEEIDGPMLQHGLKEMHGTAITVPRRPADRPDRERLDLRYSEFLKAS